MVSNKYKTATLSSINVESVVKTAISKRLPELKKSVISLPIDSLLMIDKLNDINIQLTYIGKYIKKTFDILYKKEKNKETAKLTGTLTENEYPELAYLSSINDTLIKLYNLYKDNTELKKSHAINALTKKIEYTEKTREDILNKSKKYKFFDPKAYFQLLKKRIKESITNYRLRVQSESAIKAGQYEDMLKRQGIQDKFFKRLPKDIAFILGKQNTSLFSRITSRLLRRFAPLEENSAKTSLKYKQSVWTTKDSLALTQVIPTWLSKIYKALTGKAEVFDYRTGSFRSTREVLKQEKMLAEAELNDLKKKLVAVSKKGRSTREYLELKKKYNEALQKKSEGFFSNSENNRSVLENLSNDITGNAFSKNLKEHLNTISPEEFVSKEELDKAINNYRSTFEDIFSIKNMKKGLSRLIFNNTTTQATLKPSSLENMANKGNIFNIFRNKEKINEISSEKQAKNIVKNIKRDLYTKEEYNESKSNTNINKNNPFTYIKKIYNLLKNSCCKKDNFPKMIYEYLIKNDKFEKRKYKEYLKKEKEKEKKERLAKKLDKLKTSSEYNKLKEERRKNKKEEHLFKNMEKSLKKISKNTKKKGLLSFLAGKLFSLGSFLVDKMFSLPGLIVGGLTTAFIFLKPVLKKIWHIIKRIGNFLKPVFKGIKKGLSHIGNILKKIWNVVKYIGKKLFSGIKKVFDFGKKAVDKVKNFGSNIIHKVKGWFSPSKQTKEVVKKTNRNIINKIYNSNKNTVNNNKDYIKDTLDNLKTTKTVTKGYKEKIKPINNKIINNKYINTAKNTSNSLLNKLKSFMPKTIKTGLKKAGSFLGKFIMPAIVAYDSYKKSKTIEKDTGIKHQNILSKIGSSLVGGVGSLLNETGQLVASAASGASWLLSKIPGIPDSVYTKVSKTMHKAANRINEKYFGTSAKGSLFNLIATGVAGALSLDKNTFNKLKENYAIGQARLLKYKKEDLLENNKEKFNKIKEKVINIKDKTKNAIKNIDTSSINRFIKNKKGFINSKNSSLNNAISNYTKKQKDKIKEIKGNISNYSTKAYNKISDEYANYMEKYNKIKTPKEAEELKKEIVAKLDSKNLEKHSSKTNELLTKMLEKLTELTHKTVESSEKVKDTVVNAVTTQVHEFHNTMKPMVNTVTNMPNNVFNMFANGNNNMNNGISPETLQHSQY